MSELILMKLQKYSNLHLLISSFHICSYVSLSSILALFEDPRREKIFHFLFLWEPCDSHILVPFPLEQQHKQGRISLYWESPGISVLHGWKGVGWSRLVQWCWRLWLGFDSILVNLNDSGKPGVDITLRACCKYSLLVAGPQVQSFCNPQNSTTGWSPSV